MKWLQGRSAGDLPAVKSVCMDASERRWRNCCNCALLQILYATVQLCGFVIVIRSLVFVA